MLPTKNRISKKVFLEILKNSCVFDSSFLKMRVKKVSGAVKKFSFIAPKIVSKKAVDRNLLRKRGYVIIKNVLKETLGSFYVVFFFKKGSEKLSFKDLSLAIIALLKNGAILK